MDSKSISRKGVGVRVPSLVPPTDALAHAGLVLGRALFSTLNRFLVEATQDLESAVREPRERSIGWCLGVLSAATGSDALRGRRERDGLAQFVELVEAHHRPRRFAPATGGLPRISPGKGAGWEVAFLGGYLFHLVAEYSEDEQLQWETVGEDSLVLSCGPGAERVREELAPVAALFPGAVVSVARGNLALTFPVGWLASAVS